MQKIASLFKRNPENPKLYTRELNPSCLWAQESGFVTRKWDGTAVLVQDNQPWARYEVKSGKTAPAGWVPAQAPDPFTGHQPGWVPATDSVHKWIKEAFQNVRDVTPSGMVKDGTYEAIGPKIGGNNDNWKFHTLMLHGASLFETVNPLINPYAPAPEDEDPEFPTFVEDPYESMLAFFSTEADDVEGVVFHDYYEGGVRMCKCTRRGFGLKWGGR